MPLRDGLSAYLAGGVEWGRMMQGLAQFFRESCLRRDTRPRRKSYPPGGGAMREMTYEILLAAQVRGELRPGIDLDAAARAINAWVIPVADSQLFPYLNLYFQVSDENIPFQRTLDAFLDILEHGLMTPGEIRMNPLLFSLYVVELTLLIIHEMDSTYWKEWTCSICPRAARIPC